MAAIQTVLYATEDYDVTALIEGAKKKDSENAAKEVVKQEIEIVQNESAVNEDTESHPILENDNEFGNEGNLAKTEEVSKVETVTATAVVVETEQPKHVDACTKENENPVEADLIKSPLLQDIGANFLEDNSMSLLQTSPFSFHHVN